MKQAMIWTVALLMAAATYPSALAAKDEPIIFPKEGQTKEQTMQDKSYCRIWAEEETGIDPSYVRAKIDSIKEKVNAEDEPKFGGLFKGVFKGAATGAVTGAIDSNINNKVGSDAAKGAVLGGVFTNEKQKDISRDKEYRREDLQREELKEQYDTYIKEYSVCMDAKGYSVK